MTVLYTYVFSVGLAISVAAFITTSCWSSTDMGDDQTTKRFKFEHPKIAEFIVNAINKKVAGWGQVAEVKFAGLREGTATFGDVSFSGRLVCGAVKFKLFDHSVSAAKIPEWSYFFAQLHIAQDTPSLVIVNDATPNDALLLCHGIR